MSKSGPTEDNVAAHPFFAEIYREFLRGEDGEIYGYFADIKAAFPPFFEGVPQSLLNGELASLSRWAEALGHPEAADDARASAEVILKATAHVDPLALGLHEAVQRPNCHWVDIDPQQAAGPITPQIADFTDTVDRLVSLLLTRAIAHLELGDSEAAARELLTVVQFRKIFPSDPSLIGALISTAISKRIVAHLPKLLAHQGWSDRDLARIGEVIETFSILGELQQGFDAEYASELYRFPRTMGKSDPELYPEFSEAVRERVERVVGSMVEHMPRGWRYQNMVFLTEWWNTNFMAFYDSTTRRFIRLPCSDLESFLEEPITPFNFLARGQIPQVSNFSQLAAAAQTDWDLLRVQCALQRYHLAHQSYPDSLESLVPDYLNMIPKDCVTGTDPFYKREGESFSLASLDWEQSGEIASFLCKISNSKNDQLASDHPLVEIDARADW
jgi:hypothetical protein